MSQKNDEKIKKLCTCLGDIFLSVDKQNFVCFIISSYIYFLVTKRWRNPDRNEGMFALIRNNDIKIKFLKSKMIYDTKYI